MSSFFRFHTAFGLFVVAVGSVGLGAACNSSSASTRDDFISSYCDKFTPCCKKAGLPSDGTTCRAFLTALAPPGYNATEGKACLDALDTASASASFCGSGGPGPNTACSKVFSGATGTAAPGADCTKTSDCAASSQGTVQCATGFTSMGGQIRKCQVQVVGKAGSSPCVATISGDLSESFGSDVPAMGFTCDVSSGIYCDDNTKACTAVAMVGQACPSNQTFGCGTSAYCDFTTQKCAARKPAGMMCASSEECVDGTYCDSTSKVCTTKLADGAPCTSSEPCAGNSCVNNKCGNDNSLTLAIVCGGNSSGG
jgi:hypothetical protein